MSVPSRRFALPLLCTFQGVLTQAAIDIILAELNYSYTIERYVEQQTGPFSFKIGGPLTLHDFTLRIEEGQGIPNVGISNDFKLQFAAPLIGKGELDVPFRLSSPSIRVELFAQGSKGYAIFTLSSLRMEVSSSSLSGLLSAGVGKEIWNKIKHNLAVIEKELTHSINERLREKPFELFNLDRVQLPLGQHKKIETQIVFDEFGFRDDHIAVAVRAFLGRNQPE